MERIGKLSLILGYYLVVTTYSQCGPWTVTNPDDGSEVRLDLSCLAGKTFSALDGEFTPHHYLYSMCSNRESCKDDNVMVAQTLEGDTTCYILGRWDFTKQPVFSNIDGGSWTFVYDNGDDDCSGPIRTWSPNFVCSPGTNFEVGIVEESEHCFYKVEIKTQYACKDSNYPCVDDGSDGMSGGWIFIIILFGAVFLYCLAGYFIMGLTVNKEGGLGDFSNNIPQKTMWLALPSLVVAGCMTTKDFIFGLFNKGDEMQQPIVPETDK